ncbi:hypothetical protein ACFL5K_04930 [Gemmatimonadota bacterium]
MFERCPKYAPAVFLLAFVLICFTGAADYTRADEGSQVASCKEDINEDGSTNVVDVVALLLLGRDDPENPAADYNGDGSYSITDAVALLINIMNGNLTPLVYSVTGRIVEKGLGVEGVELIIEGPEGFIAKTVTDTSGTYRFMNLGNDSYKVQPILKAYYYMFSPRQLEFIISGESLVLPDIEAAYAAFTLAGRIVEDSTTGLADVSVSVKGLGIDTVIVTASDGSYSLDSLFNAPYIVLPAKGNYTFTPYSLAITLFGDSTIQDIHAVPVGSEEVTYYQLGGRISCSVASLDNVTMVLTGDMEASTVTDGAGLYRFVVPNGTYTVVGIPVPEMQFFSPGSYTVTVDGEDVLYLDFYGFGAGL